MTMRTALVLGGMLGALSWAAHAPAQQTPAAPSLVQQTITAPGEVEVRSGPSLTYYATSKLRQGEPVVVLDKSYQKYPGWLAIRPPRGSFSWVNTLYINQQANHIGIVKDGVENTASVTVLAGSTLLNQKPSVEAAKLKTGTQVIILGEAMHADDGSNWVPIEPTAQEVRYLPAKAVEGSTAVPMPGGGVGGAVVAAPGAAATAGLTLVGQADQAYQNRDYARARQLYATAVSSSTDPRERSYCYGQLSQIEKLAGQPGVAVQPAANTTSLYNSQPGTPSGPQWSSWGRLTKTTFQKDGRPMYVLVDAKGNPLVYATTLPNMTLESYVNRSVCLYGQINYSSDQYWRNNYMLVSHVAQLPR
jgi:SH3-like domain-containing protein